MKDVVRLLRDREDWLVRRVLRHAGASGFTAFTSPLEEAWRLSVEGLTDSVEAVLTESGTPALSPETPRADDPAVAFAIEEARRHRERGVGVGMFLGLLKLHRRTFLECLRDSPLEADRRREAARRIGLAFDRIEIALCEEWAARSRDDLVRELRAANLRLTNEKNAYQTVLESLDDPVVLLDPDGVVWAVNHRAATLVDHDAVPGGAYYGDEGEAPGIAGRPVREVFPWLAPALSRILAGGRGRAVFEVEGPGHGTPRAYEVRLGEMLDVTERFAGTVVVLHDVTDRKRLAESLEVLATTDPLTEVSNRRAFLARAETELLRARRYGHGLALLELDVDHFKDVNDAFGHHVGDEALREIARVCREALRGCDHFGRIGGEEFAAALVETDLAGALGVAERLRRAVADLEIEAEGGPVRLTVSVGVAGLRPEDVEIGPVLVRADSQLYRAKREGRDRVAAPRETEARTP